MLKKITSEESLQDNSTAELDALKHRDWVRQNSRTQQKTMQHCLELTRAFSCGEERAQLAAVVVCFPGMSVGAADEGAPAGSEAEEGAGAALQHPAHRIQPDTL